MKNLLIEIGVEDLPASKCKDILIQLKENLPRILKEYRLEYKSIDYYLTLRRIAFKINNISEYQIGEKIDKRGPPVSLAFDNSGNPTVQLIGFLKNNNASLQDIQVKKIQDKEYVFILIEKESKNIREVIQEMIIKIIKSFRFEKTMYWISKDFTFIRPIRWIACLLDNDPIEIEYYKTEKFSYKSSNYTIGHRIFNPKKIRIKSADSYTELLRESMVIPEPKIRENLIKDSISKVELETGLKTKISDNFIEELVYMYEYPVAFLSEYDENYKSLPPEIIITVLQKQQRFIPLHENDILSNKFLVFKEGEVTDIEVNKYNYKKVVEARLEDAIHLYREDRKVLLASRIPKLKEILYHEKLGSLYDKTIRVKAITEYICQLLNVDSQILDFALKAATLCKADRTTKIVFEYPNLQGIIGRYLAIEQGENEIVANAIYEHYLPETPEDKRYPSRYEGIILAIADRIDTIVSLIAVGNQIKGSTDILGLRRTLSTLTNILHNFKIPLNLEELISFSYSILEDKKYGIEIYPQLSLNKVIKEIKEFIFNRIEENYKLEGKNYDKIRSVLHIFFRDYNLADNILEFIDQKPLDSLIKFVETSKRLKKFIFDDFIAKENIDENLFPYSFEIYNNIEVIDYPEDTTKIKINEALLQKEEEKELYNFIEENQDLFSSLNRENIVLIFQKIKVLNSIIDRFFDNVYIKTEEYDLRINRVLLLYKAFLLISKFADFNKIQI